MSPLQFLQLIDAMKANYKTIQTMAACRSGARVLVGAAVANMPADGEARLANKTVDVVAKYDKVAQLALDIFWEQAYVNVVFMCSTWFANSLIRFLHVLKYVTDM